jgi:hypothetical protein
MDPAVAKRYGGQDFGELSRVAANEREFKNRLIRVHSRLEESSPGNAHDKWSFSLRRSNCSLAQPKKCHGFGKK